MKFLFIFGLILYFGANLINDSLKRQKPSDAQLTKLVEEMNKKMPVIGDILRIERVEVANRKITYFGTIREGQVIDQEWNAKARAWFLAQACSNKAALGDVAFAYNFDQVVLRNFSDKLKRETFSGEVAAADCK